MEDTAIKVRGVSKNFRLPHEKTGSVKNVFTGIFKLVHKNRSYETQHALEDVSFEIKKGEFFGIVGRNGSGKSTMLKMLAGIYQPTRGSIQVSGKLVPFIELGVGFSPELTGRENVYLNGALLGFSKKEIDDQYDDIVEFAEIEQFMDQKLKNYSSGMQVRLAFSMAIRAKADVLLVDEVLAVGDADFQRKCFDYFQQLKGNDTTVVFVTHDMNAVREYCDRALLIDNSKVKIIGRPDIVAQQYSKLFMKENKTTSQGKEDNDLRWGNGDAKFKSIDVEHIKDQIVITARVKAKKNIEKMIYGVHIFSISGTELTATNNRMISVPDIENLAEGDEVELVWGMLNIFNDGKYIVQLTLVGSNNTVYDWYKMAEPFTVKRMERSTTPIIPPVKVSTKISKAQKEK